MSNKREPQFFNETHKKCSTCRQLKLFSEFTNDKRNKHGNYLSHSCRKCSSETLAKSRSNVEKKVKVQYVTDTHKTCSFCRELKLHDEFHKDKNNKKGKGLAYYCKECASKKSIAFHHVNKSNPKYKRYKKAAYVLVRHKISLEEYEERLRQQNNSCAICSNHLPMHGHLTHLDHNHDTGMLRKFLCTNCNRGLGFFQDSEELLMKASKYLAAHTDDGNQKEGTGL
jgi:DNA-directed RNA polymerase subunit RPC12/RpoP